MRFEGRVWRYLPAHGHPLDYEYLINASGRWNRPGLYGCLYTAPAPAAAIAEYRKVLRRRGQMGHHDLASLDVEIDRVLDLRSPPKRGGAAEPLRSRTGTRPAIDRDQITGDGDGAIDHCREIADWARRSGYVAVAAPSAARDDASVLAIYPENRPDLIQIKEGPERLPLGYGPDALLDEAGHLQRPLP